MTRSDWDIFNDHVTVLVRELGLELEALDEAHRQRLLGQARKRRLNEHEAALQLAYHHALGRAELEPEDARVLLERLALVAGQWQEGGLVDRSLVADLDKLAADVRRDLRGWRRVRPRSPRPNGDGQDST